MTITQWHVPIDDHNCYWFSIFTSFDKPVDKALMREQRLKEHTLPDYAPIKNKQNHYHYDATEQSQLTYTGMGMDINVHDQWAVEGMGSIQDRTTEHLGKTDVGIILYRRLLREAIDGVENGDDSALPMREGTDPSGIFGPLSSDSITATDTWEKESARLDQQRRVDCPWDAKI